MNPFEAPSHEDGPVRSTSDSGGVVWLLLHPDGRISRSTFWLLTLLTFASFCGSVLAVGAVASAEVTEFVFVMLHLPLIWITLALQFKRWHDRGKSAFWALIALIPLLGVVWTFVELGCLRGTVGPNPYGDDPT